MTSCLIFSPISSTVCRKPTLCFMQTSPFFSVCLEVSSPKLSRAAGVGKGKVGVATGSALGKSGPASKPRTTPAAGSGKATTGARARALAAPSSKTTVLVYSIMHVHINLCICAINVLLSTLVCLIILPTPRAACPFALRMGVWVGLLPVSGLRPCLGHLIAGSQTYSHTSHTSLHTYIPINNFGFHTSFTEQTKPGSGSKATTSSSQVPKTRSHLPTPSTKSPLQSRSTSTENLHTKTGGVRTKKATPTAASKQPPPRGPSRSQVKPSRVAHGSSEAASHTVASRGVRDKKQVSEASRKLPGNRAVELTDEETDIEDRSAPFTGLVPSKDTRVDTLTPPHDPGLIGADDPEQASAACSQVSLICGSRFPEQSIPNPEDCDMFRALAQRVQKWKMLGRYLGVEDEVLDKIESVNHFANERCLKMLVHWGRREGTYRQLETGLHNIMREDLVEDLQCYLPPEPIDLVEKTERLWECRGLDIRSGKINTHELKQRICTFANQDHSSQVKVTFCHAKLSIPLEFYLPLSSTCDLTVLEELCFASASRSVTTVDIIVEIV